MARIIHSSGILHGARVTLLNGSIAFTGGTRIAGLPTLYDRDGHFVEPVNLWFSDLKLVQHLADINSSVRALLRYWNFLESENMQWDDFPPVNRLKPTYQFRCKDLLKAAEEGRLAYTTARTYMRHVIQFYLWAINNARLIIPETKAAPFTLEFIERQNNDMLAHLRPRIIVQTTDLRIRIPGHADPDIHRLCPLTKSHLAVLSRHLNDKPVEFVLMVLLGCECGLRLKEVCTFTLQALQQAIPTCDHGSRFHIPIGPSNGVDTKFRKKRTIEISHSLLTLLQRYAISERRMGRVARMHIKTQAKKFPAPRDARSIPAPDRHEPLFVSQQGNHIKPEVLNARWVEFRNAVSRAEPGFRYRFHDLRSTYATYRLDSLLNSGLSEGEALDCIMAWMGHSHEKTTLKYIRFLKRNDTLKFAFSLLDAIMARFSDEAV